MKNFNKIECSTGIFDSKSAAEYLSLSINTLYKMTSNGELTFYKPNNKLIYFKKEDLDEWVLSNKHEKIEVKSLKRKVRK